MTRRLRFSLAGWEAIVGGLAISASSVFYFSYRGTAMAVTIAFSLATAVFNVAAIPFFVIGMRLFQQEMRRTYKLVCIGIALFAFAQLQIPVASITNNWAITNSGIIGIPFFASVLFLFLATRGFANLMHVKSWMMSLPLALGAATLGGLLTAALPFALPEFTEKSVGLAAGFIVWSGIMSFISAALIIHIVRAASAIYAMALTRLNAALIAMGMGAVHYAIVALFVSPDSWYVNYSLTIVPLLIGSVLFVWAGVSFNLIGEQEPARPVGSKTTSLNIITYVASLASDQHAIDHVLDDARYISATMAPGQVPDLAMQRKLAGVYLRLEEYLTTQESLQLYSKESLRRRIEQTLHVDPTDEDTFWPLILSTD